MSGNRDLGEGWVDRRPWWQYLSGKSLVLWSAIGAIGVLIGLGPFSFPLQNLVSGAVAGTGVAGLLTEFTFAFNRRDDDVELSRLRERYVALERQVQVIDGLAAQSSIMATTQLFRLGIDVYQVRFLDGALADLFRDEARYLGQLLRLTHPVTAFLDNRYLRAAEGLPPPGMDPFGLLGAATRRRYPREGVAALQAGATVGTIMHTAQGLNDPDYRQTALPLLREALDWLYLPAPVTANLGRALDGLEQGAVQPGHLAGYLTLFTFYLGHRMSGGFEQVGPLFEEPLSLADPGSVQRIVTTLQQLSGATDSDTAPVTASSSPDTPPPATDHPVDAPSSLGPPPQPAGSRWYGYTRWGLVGFWSVVALCGIVAAVLPVTFTGKDLLTSSVAGAGLAGVIAELMFSTDRRLQAAAAAEVRHRLTGLADRAAQVDRLLTRARLVKISQMFRLGTDLSRVRFAAEQDVASFRDEAIDLADFFGISAPVDRFLNSPHLRPSETTPAGVDPFPALREALSQMCWREDLFALNVGAALGVLLDTGLRDPTLRTAVADLVRGAVGHLYLTSTAQDNLTHALADLTSDRVNPRVVVQYLVTFDLYLDHRISGRHPETVALFEQPLTITDPAAAKAIQTVLAAVANPAS